MPISQFRTNILWPNCHSGSARVCRASKHYCGIHRARNIDGWVDAGVDNDCIGRVPLIFGLYRFGFINHFDKAVGTAVRKHRGVAAEGSVSLSRWVDGNLVLGGEIFFPRKEYVSRVNVPQ